MTVFQVLTLLIMFATLIVALISLIVNLLKK